MKFSNETISVLKNFASINSGILFKEGNVISTVSPQKNILADANIQETIPKQFGVYNLNEFLSVLSLFKGAGSLAFSEHHVLISSEDGRTKIKYKFASPSMIVVAPDKRPTLPTVDVSFDLSSEDFDLIMKTASVLGSPNVGIISDGSSVFLSTFSVNDDSAHENLTELSIESTGNYRLVFKTENMKMLPGDYLVEISSKGIAKFSGKTTDVVYFVTLEVSSQYN